MKLSTLHDGIQQIDATAGTFHPHDEKMYTVTGLNGVAFVHTERAQWVLVPMTSIHAIYSRGPFT